MSRVIDYTAFIVAMFLFIHILAFADDLSECERTCVDKDDCERCEAAATGVYEYE